MQRQPNKRIIITRRVWQLMAVMAFVVLTSFTRHNPLGFSFSFHLFTGVFIIVFSLTYMREERRATKSPNSNLIINCNLAEATLLLFSLLALFIVTFIKGWDDCMFHAYFDPCALALLTGVALGELMWQNISLRKLDESCRQRYWASYKNSIW